MTFTVDDAVLLTVVGLVIKEGSSMFVKIRMKKKDNGKENGIRGLLEDIRGQGKVTLDKVAGIEKEQGDIKVALKGVTTDMINFRDKCIDQEARMDVFDQRFFDHIKQAGGK